MKTLKELINLEEPAWELVLDWLKNAKNHYEILDKDYKRAKQELVNAQVTTHSPLGAVIYETGGILIDYGWLRILGSGNSKLDRGVMEWNKGKTYQEIDEKPGFLLVADDIVGGYFAINAGAIGHAIENIYYLAPDTLKWENLECGYSDFLYWTFTGNLEQFYKNVRWKNWRKDIKKADGNQTILFYPFFWTQEGQDIEKLNKKLISTEEHYRLMIEMKSC